MPTQILPKDDAFAYGPVHYGNNVILYLGCKASTSSTPFAWGNGKMHSAYHATLGTTAYTNAGITTADSESEANQLRARGMMFRAPFAEGSTATAVVQMLPLAGTPDDSHLAPRGVMGRIQGGTLASATGDEVRYEDVSCYLATVHRDVSGNVIFAIRKCSSGTFSLLANQTLAPASVALLPVLNPLTITLTLAGGSGDTTVDASFRGWGSIADIDLSASDSSAIAGSGRYGFLMGRDRADATDGIDVADICTSFSVTEGSTLKLLDSFSRYQLSSFRSVTDQFGNGGNSLQGAFGWDHFQPSQVRRMKRSTAAEAAQYFFDGTDASGSHRAMLSSRPATSSISQHRSAALTFSAQPTVSDVRFGIAVRASDPVQAVGVTTPLTCYVASVVARVSPNPVRFLLERYVSGGTTRQLASFDDAGSTYWPGYASPLTLELEVHNSLGLLNDDVVLTVKVDGVQVPLVDVSGLSGVSVDGSGTVTDGSGGRIGSGYGEGFLALTDGAENAVDVTIDDWTESALTNSELADQDQASVIVLDEGTAVGSLNDVIGNRGIHSEELEQFGSTQQFESGHVQGVAGFTDSSYVPIMRRRFQLAVVLDATGLANFRTFWDDHDGIVIPFTWQREFDSAPWKVHFLGDYDEEYVRPNTWRVSFVLETLTSHSVAALVAARPSTFSDELGHGI